MALHHDTATDEEVIGYCTRSNPDRKVLFELEGGVLVVQISDEAIVKCGFGVTEDEAQNQRRAHELINPSIVRVPRVYRFFAADQVGYLVMEFIEGKTLDSFVDPTICVEKVAEALCHFAQIRCTTPGPLGGGVTYGLLWLHSDWIVPDSVRDIEEYYNRRQLKRSLQKLDIEDYPLVLCHLDVAPRNVIRLGDGSICLLDWASAGFYPRLFEICTLRLNVLREGDWNSRLLQLVGDLSNTENTQTLLLEHAYYLGEKYHYGVGKPKPVLPPGFKPRKKRKKRKGTLEQPVC